MKSKIIASYFFCVFTMTPEKRIITTERRAELADLVGFFEVLIQEDQKQKSLQKYEILHR